MTDKLIVELIEKTEGIFDEFSKQLFASFSFSKNESSAYNQKLIFPTYSNKEIRVSEQEARFAFCNVLEKTDNEFLYSVETPTVKKYSFSEGGGEQSAMTDLTLHYKRTFANVEFKAHSVDKKNITKDFKKLIREDVPVAIFIQVFENIDKGTIENFFEKKLKLSVKEVLEKTDEKEIQEKKFILYICCLDKKTKHHYVFENIEALENCISKKEDFKKKLMAKTITLTE